MVLKNSIFFFASFHTFNGFHNGAAVEGFQVDGLAARADFGQQALHIGQVIASKAEHKLVGGVVLQRRLEYVHHTAAFVFHRVGEHFLHLIEDENTFLGCLAGFFKELLQLVAQLDGFVAAFVVYVLVAYFVFEPGQHPCCKERGFANAAVSIH